VIDIAPAWTPGPTGGTVERRPTRVLVASADEVAVHDAYLAELDAESRGGCLWLRLAHFAVAEGAARAA
jgi:hypothetical protein